ncbi:MAG: UDP-N-acetylglucosamine 2-epimerase (non-hydrolyzing) [Legionellaceae bacterium]|nr:UDP-N-acetylglucosamine 2-epimerase (non-hydrolyzing) [Legionellaceae bacterium]
MKKILTVIGARPQFIKAAALTRVLSTNQGLTEILVHTGQHYDNNMSDVFFNELELPKPQYNLAIGSSSHGKQTGDMLAGLEDVFQREKPDLVLIYGDTNSTLAAALAASKMHIPVAHVEAGLRSFNRKMPEEINRIVADQLSTLLFVPTEGAHHHLKSEGVPEEKIHFSGDVMYDVALYFGKKAETTSPILKRLELSSSSYILATIHRAENTDDPKRLMNIMQALMEQGQKMPIVLPLHPRTHAVLKKYHLLDDVQNILHVIEPVGFLDMIMLEKNASLIVTDSGGVQKEAFFYHVPCVTLRDETEWQELVDMGWNTVVSPENKAMMTQVIERSLTQVGDLTQRPYGMGDAALKIACVLHDFLEI